MFLDKRSRVPLYAQLKEILSERIQTGYYAPGEKIPTELALCEELELSRPTVRQAIAELVAEGALVIEKGRGTFVTKQPDYIDIQDYDAQTFSFGKLDENEKRRMIDYRLLEEISPQLATTLCNMNVTKGVIELIWLDSQKKDPHAFAISYLSAAENPDLLDKLQAGRANLTNHCEAYAQSFKLFHATANLTLRPASGDEARYLDLVKGTAVFVHEAFLYTEEGNQPRLHEWNTTVMRADRYRFNLLK